MLKPKNDIFGQREKNKIKKKKKRLVEDIENNRNNGCLIKNNPN